MNCLSENTPRVSEKQKWYFCTWCQGPSFSDDPVKYNSLSLSLSHSHWTDVLNCWRRMPPSPPPASLFTVQLQISVCYKPTDFTLRSSHNFNGFLLIGKDTKLMSLKHMSFSLKREEEEEEKKKQTHLQRLSSVGLKPWPLTRSQYATGRSCGRPDRSKFSSVLFGAIANAELVPKFHSCVSCSPSNKHSNRPTRSLGCIFPVGPFMPLHLLHAPSFQFSLCTYLFNDSMG